MKRRIGGGYADDSQVTNGKTRYSCLYIIAPLLREEARARSWWQFRK
jgi:hypothetical protein